MLLGVAVIMMATVLLAARRQLFVPFLIAGVAAWVWIHYFSSPEPKLANYLKPQHYGVKAYVLKEPTTIGCDTVSALKGVLADAPAQAARSQIEQETYLASVNCRLIKNSPSLWWNLNGIEDNGTFFKLSSFGDGPTLIYAAADFKPQ